MRISGIKSIAAVVFVSALLGGCGEAPYELTQSEQNIIIDYSAHVVAKHNTSQKKGLVTVDMEEVAPEETETPSADSAAELADNAGGETPSAGTEQPETEAAVTATLNDIFGGDGLPVEYTGASIAENYMESTYYSVEAEAGRNLLVVGINFINTGTEDVEVDNLSLSPSFRITVNGDTSAAAVTTVLTEDFPTYQGPVAAGATQGTVLLFQVPDAVTEVQDLEMTVTMGEANYQISL